jgi:hypothetical protein
MGPLIHAEFDSNQDKESKFGRLASKYMRLSLVLALLNVAVLLLFGEILIRSLIESDPQGPLVGNVRLLPRYWPDVAHHWQRQWRRHHSNAGIFVFDPILGWTIAPNREGIGASGELLFSSAEGARARYRGEIIKSPSKANIALIGDSYVFGSDVNFEDTWAYHLEQSLRSDVRVLNFGVPGYGVDQAYLRYVHHVRDLQPRIAILALISHDVLRTSMVYYAVGFPSAVAPGPKPRFILRDEQLKLINTPLPLPGAVYKIKSIEQLPYIVYDSAYRPSDWQSHWYDFLYLFRFLASVSFHDVPSTETVLLNGAILKSFVRDAISNGTLPLIVYLPSYSELGDGTKSISKTRSLGVAVLEEAKVDFVDLTDCVGAIEERRRFTEGWHYTTHTNAILADCLREVVIAKLSQT